MEEREEKVFEEELEEVEESRRNGKWGNVFLIIKAGNLQMNVDPKSHSYVCDMRFD